MLNSTGLTASKYGDTLSLHKYVPSRTSNQYFFAQITLAPWYVYNLSLHKGLKIETVPITAKNY